MIKHVNKKPASLIYILISIFAILYSEMVTGQSLPIGTPALEDAYRRAQLLGLVDSSVSFTSRPFFPNYLLQKKGGFNPDSILNDSCKKRWDGSFNIGKIKGVIKRLPITWINQLNSDRPAGFNDGAMIPARGYQTLFSGGMYFSLGPLSIQLKPEVVYAENSSFQGFPEDQPAEVWKQYFDLVLNNIDMPERFGEKAYSKMTWGQSSIRLYFGPMSIGISNENLWWGPGIQNSLLMSNTAPGFKHITLNTIKPIRTAIGSFEGQLIVGKLDSSGYMPLPSASMALHKDLYFPKIDDWRYLNGIVFSYQPKWTPGIFLGLTRCYYQYSKDLGKSIGDYLPVITPLFKKNLPNEDEKQRDEVASIFIRWLMVKENAEIYVEYGKNDHNYNIRDFTQEPEHSRAYIFGLSKLFAIKSQKNEFVQFNFELTQIESDKTVLDRTPGSWYVHYQVRQGYTNQGQLLGAGIGSGSNMQSINISWIKNIKRVGLGFERVVNNNDFHYTAINNIRSHWIDLGISAFGEWNFKNILITAKFEGIRTLNYEHYRDPSLAQSWGNGNSDLYNFHGQVGVYYKF